MKHLVKDAITYLIMGAILLFSAYNAWKDETEMHSHYDFFNSMAEFKQHTEEFMKRGGRNTADMGENLCNRLNILEFHTSDDTELTDCDEIYSGKEQ